MNQELQALLFDVDGTLADTEEVHRTVHHMQDDAANFDTTLLAETELLVLKIAHGFIDLLDELAFPVPCAQLHTKL